MQAVALLGAGVTLTLAGYLGPEDGGVLELVGLIIVAIGVALGVAAAYPHWKGLI